MKTNKMIYWPLMLVVLVFGLVSCYDDSDIVKRLDALENNTIASINEQITAINSSLTSLDAVDKELKSSISLLEEKQVSIQDEIKKLNEEDSSMQGFIEELKKEDSVLKDEIEKLSNDIASIQIEIDSLITEDTKLLNEIEILKDAEIALDAKIQELNTYVNNEISSTKDWASATLATLEHYDSICVVLVGIETSIKDLKTEFTEALAEAITESETSMKEWVNEQLTGYWTIAETQARLDSIKQTESKDFAKLSDDLNTAKTELTTAYTTAITEAIEKLDGKLSDEIVKINDNLEKKITSIEGRLDKIEETLNDLTREFSITFDDTEIGILPGGKTSVGYKITGATENTIVKALGQNGWSAKVTPDGSDKGTISVIAPDPLTEDEIIVLVYDGAYRTIMSSINFVTGVVTTSQTAVELEAEAGTVDIELSYNLNYKVSIPEEAQDWLSVVETRSMKSKTIAFAYTECIGGIRKAIVSFVDEADNVISSMTFIQQGSAVEVTLAEAGTLHEAIGVDTYLNLKNLKINGPINGTDVTILRKMCSAGNLIHLDLENAHIVSGGKPYHESFVTEDNVIGPYMFRLSFENSDLILETIILPKSTIKIGDMAFLNCQKLKSVKMFSNIKTIGDFVFDGCNLSTIEFPNSITSIGRNSLTYNRNLSKIVLPDNLEEISAGLLYECSSLLEITIPENVKKIGEEAFYNCSLLYKIIIPKKVIEIENSVFSGCSKLKSVHIESTNLTKVGSSLFPTNVYSNATLYIPKGTRDSYFFTDFDRFANIVEEE